MKLVIYFVIIISSNIFLFADEEIYELKHITEFNKGSGMSLRDLSCIDENNCILLHSDEQTRGMIAKKTTDGGKTWKIIFADTSTTEPKYLSKNYGQFCKYFPSGLLILLGEFGKIMRSEDYGETFEEFNIEHFRYNDFEMLDEQRAVAVSIKFGNDKDVEPGILRSSDGCKTWQKFNIPDSISKRFKFYSITQQKNEDLIIWSYPLNKDEQDSTKSFYFRTDFEGSFWQPLSSPRYLDKIIFFDENEGLSTGKKTKMSLDESDTAFTAKTYNAGKTWEIKMKSTPPHDRLSFDYYTDSLITLYGSGFGFFKSTDKGESWFMPVLNTDSSIFIYTLFTRKVILFESGSFYISTGWYEQLLKGTRVNTSVQIPSVNPKKIYPNPVSLGSTFTSDYEIERSGYLRIYMSDVSGKEISSLYSGFAEAGSYSTPLRLPDNISSGSYWLNTEINGFRHVQMLNVVR